MSPCHCEPINRDKCCSACDRRARCKTACHVYTGWEVDCRDEVWRQRQMQQRRMDELGIDWETT